MNQLFYNLKIFNNNILIQLKIKILKILKVLTKILKVLTKIQLNKILKFQFQFKLIILIANIK